MSLKTLSANYSDHHQLARDLIITVYCESNRGQRQQLTQKYSFNHRSNEAIYSMRITQTKT